MQIPRSVFSFVCLALSALLVQGQTTGPDCWTTTKNMRLPGLTGVGDRTFTECKELCSGTKECWSFEYRNGATPKCKIQKQSFPVSVSLLEPALGVTNYILEERCRSPMSLVADKCWMPTSLTYLQNLVRKVTATTLAACKDVCLKDRVCRAVQFDATTQTCSIHQQDARSEENIHVLDKMCKQ